MRQQLCIMDSLVAAVGGPGGTPGRRVNKLAMGTFGPAVDFLTVKKIREADMAASHSDVADRFLTAFGYQPTAGDNLDFVTVAPSGVAPGRRAAGADAKELNVVLLDNRFMIDSASFPLPRTRVALRLTVHDAAGRRLGTIATVDDTGKNASVTWNGAVDGRMLGAGTYVLKLQGAGFVRSATIRLVAR